MRDFSPAFVGFESVIYTFNEMNILGIPSLVYSKGSQQKDHDKLLVPDHRMPLA